MLINREAIEELIPHTGSMCLLDSVARWDDQSIECLTASHRRQDNPFLLDSAGTMDATFLVEYGAQAAAVHAALLQQGMAGQGTAYLGAIKKLNFFQRQVDLSIDHLIIKARCELNTTEGAIYQLDCSGGDEAIIAARVVLVLPPIV